MRQLRRWADLSYRQLERNATDAGDVLPRATISAALTRDELPREELLAAYVRACGGDDGTVSAWLEARRSLVMTGAGTPPAVSEDVPRTTALQADDDTPQGTPQSGEEAADEKQDPATDPADEPIPLPTAASATGPAVDSPGLPHARSNWRRQGPLVAIAACTVAGILTLALWPHDNGTGDDRADNAPTSAPPPSTAAGTTPSAAPSDDAESKQPGSSPTASRSATADPAASPLASPVDHEETTPSSSRPSPTPKRTDDSAPLPATGWTGIHPASAPSRCLTEGRERNGRTTREIAVQHSCADAPLPRVYLEKLGGQTYRIQWHHPEHGTGCLAVDGASTTSGALLAPRDCADSDSQKFRLEAAGGGFRLRPLHSGLCVGFLPPVTDGAEAVQTACTGTSGQAFTFTPS
ncbi:RICIN domain-containing protein [Streptomyces lancefieldiae]|uniref:RICIN domain-containing protein n=1 Tax=Streptomyces lancefieldiae TaxID=3075520 RepID=A0ABU3ASY8_9ACTN|nr:RICIN domain-containing protein [Streptomyces sp. DSM 40712]MDT0612707.1 RICIN domain-containing protein [Streptomyces sp. DSM 40712]